MPVIPVQSMQLGVQWQCGLPVGQPLRVTFGAARAETTVDAMLRGEGHALVRPEQLAHLIAGMAFSAELTPVQFKNSDGIDPADRMTLTSILSTFGYSVELC